jgi:hypothetical protein
MMSFVCLFIAFTLFAFVVHGKEDNLSPGEHKPGDYVVTIEPDGCNGNCIGVAQLQYLYEHADAGTIRSSFTILLYLIRFQTKMSKKELPLSCFVTRSKQSKLGFDAPIHKVASRSPMARKS